MKIEQPLLVALLLAGCSDIPDSVTDSSRVADQNDIAYSMTLDDLSARSYPTTAAEWVINDENANLKDFNGFAAALSSRAAASKRNESILISFPNLTTLPSGLFEGLDLSALSKNEISLEVYLKKITALENGSFESCGEITSLFAPMVTSLGARSLAGCENLQSVTIAMGDKLEKFDDVFDESDDLSNLVLTLNVANEDCVDGAELTIEDRVYTFNNIIQDNPALVDLNDKASALTLSDITGDSYPSSAESWVIVDGEVQAADFEGLKSALHRASQKSIDIRFSNLTTMPTDAFASCDANNLVSLTLDNVATIESGAFSGFSNLTSVTAPCCHSVGEAAFDLNEKLTSLTLATKVLDEVSGESVLLTSLGSVENPIFGSDAASVVTLTLGGSNRDLVTDKSITLAGVTYQFADIAYDESEVTDLGVEAQPLSSFSYKSYPTTTTNWAIDDSEAQAADLAGLKAAIGRYVMLNPESSLTLVFNDMTTISANLFDGFNDDVSVIVICPKVTTLEESAFAGASSIEAIELPKTTNIGALSFASMPNLKSLKIATSYGARLAMMGAAYDDSELLTKRVFGDGVEPSNVSLTIGDVLQPLAGEYTSNIDDTTNTLTVQNSVYQFAAIEVAVDPISANDITSLDDVAATGIELSQFGLLSFPVEEDVWVISDSGAAPASSFVGLREALASAALVEAGREITLRFSNLTTFTSFADFDLANEVKIAVELPVAGVVEAEAFKGNSAVVSVSLPQCYSVGYSAFNDTAALEYVEFATEYSGAEIVTFGADAAYACGAWGAKEDLSLVNPDQKVTFKTKYGLGAVSERKSWTIEGLTYEFANDVEYADNALDLKADALTISDLSVDSFPLNSSRWVILDDFSDTSGTLIGSTHIVGLVNALKGAAALEPGREVTIVFANMSSTENVVTERKVGISKTAFSNFNMDLKVSMELPLAGVIKSLAFSDATALVSIKMPMGFDINAGALSGATNMTYIEFGTEYDNVAKISMGFNIAPGCSFAENSIFGDSFDKPNLELVIPAGFGTVTDGVTFTTKGNGGATHVYNLKKVTVIAAE